MIMSGGATTGVTAVECEKQVRSWRLLRSVAELLIPTCNCMITHEDQDEPTLLSPKQFLHKRSSSASASASASASVSTVFGTLYGHRRGKVSFCIQTNPNSVAPILLLELAIPTNVLAKEMKGGSIRLAFESKAGSGSDPLLSMPAWTMYCNGRRVGFAVKRKPSRADVELLQKIQNVVVGAGIASLDDDDVMYLRGMFERCHASANAHSFHLIDDHDYATSNAQELSFYFLRS